ncbi:MAG: ribonuclease HII, partial [Candidatus Nomurabacteria bacterium]|nr:ribonuclease HII [Candidatus Nomurabacteria bacterium]
MAILGVDEVGRGAWAGPLVVGAVVLAGPVDGLADSKLLTKKRREELNKVILSSGAAVGLGWVPASEIDEIGLGAALRLATRRAVEQIEAPYHEIIIDGTVNFLADTAKGKYVTTLKKADQLIAAVSAASIVAKVARDAYMVELDSQHSGYGFANHVGYGTAAHRAALAKLGPCAEHRLSFRPVSA